MLFVSCIDKDRFESNLIHSLFIHLNYFKMIWKIRSVYLPDDNGPNSLYFQVYSQSPSGGFYIDSVFSTFSVARKRREFLNAYEHDLYSKSLNDSNESKEGTDYEV